jgi:group II intron reverse transcriptase/maturase
MLNAPKYLSIVRKRGEAGKPLERVHRIIRKPEILQVAYMNLYANEGAMTPGADPEDVIDGMSMKRIMDLSDELRQGTFRWKPVRRVYVPKANGQKRPIGVPGWKDKMVQEAMRLALGAYYEPQFSSRSHGFRSGRGCHTALTQIVKYWTATKWFIEGDIKGCFDNIDHETLIAVLTRSIHDDRLLKLIRQMLAAGYLEDWRYHQTLSGTPQGGVISPLLANVYLNELDKFVEDELVPRYTRGDRRRVNLAYSRLLWAMKVAKENSEREGFRRLRAQRNKLPYGDPFDPHYRRLRYVRYADDVLLGFIGPKNEAEDIRDELAQFLREELKLELSTEKTLITHARTSAAKFLGYEIQTGFDNSKQAKGRRSLNGRILLRMPRKVMAEWSRKFMRRGKTYGRLELASHSDYDIVQKYALEFSGIVNYYLLAINVSRLNDLKYVMMQSLVKTLAMKHRIRAKKVYRRYGTRENGRTVIRVTVQRSGKKPLIATFGDKSCRRSTEPLDISDAIPRLFHWRVELLERMLADKCELCGAEGNTEVHHIRKLSDLKRQWQGKQMPEWVKWMAARNRKTLVVCQRCHRRIHNGEYDAVSLTKL